MMNKKTVNRVRLKRAAMGVALALGVMSLVPGQVYAADTTHAEVQRESGLYLQGFDRSVRPQDNLFRHVNGTWYDQTQIPSDMSSYGAFRILAEENEKRLKSIIDELVARDDLKPGSNEQKLRDFYLSYMDQDKIDALGVTPIKPELDRIAAISSKPALIYAMADLRQVGVGIPFSFYAWADAKNPDYNALYLSQSGLGLPDRDYYFRDTEDAERIRTAYKRYLEDMLRLAGYDQAKQRAARIYQLEKTLAEHHWTRAKRRDAQATYNKMPIEALNQLMGGFDYARFAKRAGIDKAGEVVVRMPSYFEALGQVFEQTSLQAWQDYLTIRTLNAFAPRLNHELVERQFAFYSKTLNGIPEQRDRWKRGVQATEGVLGEALGQEYVARYFPPQAKARMETMIDNLRAAFKDSIESLAWMSDETKAKALDKLSKFTPKIGYPEQWEDYSALTINADDLIGNSKRAARWGYQDMLSRIGAPVDRKEWGMTPQTVNAYYSPTANEIVFPAGILQPPFFDMNADDAVNYGGIGAVIGHEMGHGFDDQGSRYDGDGNLANWWTDEDRARFDARTQKLAEQFSQFEPLPGLFIDGKVSLGENIGDLVGLTTAFRAYQKSLHGEPSPVMDGYTGEQRFFLSWGQIWKMKMREDALRERVSLGPHAPPKYRVLGAPRNVPAFYEAFDIKEGDGMYLPEDQRVNIW
ncbi:M13 family metallopeptidase [Salinivibrio sp. VYel1]|uniref:M13 family metallopeptidase n=1 Tax=Salinivibrio sp. VYel1 TaxID=2490490 RepID=UPI001D148C54|nr:M13 family metallopeptidase [Salinivibrio sp. VYel1]